MKCASKTEMFWRLFLTLFRVVSDPFSDCFSGQF